jgi:hypothetical protein
MNDGEEQFIPVFPLRRALLKTQELIGAEIILVIALRGTS